MSSIKRKWDRLKDEERKSAIDQIIYYFKNERDEEIGVVAAQQLLDFFLEHIGGAVYNKGIDDAKEALEKRIDEFRYDLYDLTEN